MMPDGFSIIGRERRGAQPKISCSLALATVLADIDLIVALVHAEQPPAGCAAVGILGCEF